MGVCVLHAEVLTLHLGLTVRVGLDVVRLVLDASLKSAVQGGIRQVVVYGSLIYRHVAQPTKDTLSLYPPPLIKHVQRLPPQHQQNCS